MAIPTAKLLKIGGPALTGVGGVFATSSLVSKSADEKPEEKLKTSALKDEEPPIEEYEDANEGECKKTKDSPCKGGQKPAGSKGEDGDQGEQRSGSEDQPASQQGEATQSDSDFSQETQDGNEEKGQKQNGDSEEGKEESVLSTSEKGDDGLGSDDEKHGEGVTEGGSDDAQHNHASGTAYGTEDRAMTLQDLERTKRTKSDLENLKSQLLGLIGT